MSYYCPDEDTLVLYLNSSEKVDLNVEGSGEIVLEAPSQGEASVYVDKDPVLVINNYTSSGSGGTGFVDQASWLVIEKNALTNMSAYNLVRFHDADTVELATNNTVYNEAKVVGITIAAALAGNKVKVLILGVLEDPFFTWPANTLLFLGANGIITSTPPTSGFSTIVGEAPVPGVFSLSIREPTIL